MNNKNYMKGLSVLLVSLLMGVLQQAAAQDMKKFSLYKPAEDAAKGIEAAVAEAARTGKHVFVQVGGNWCIWCARFHDLVSKDNTLDSIMQANYVVYHLNYSQENTNAALLKKYRFPQRFGFPVFLVLDAKGNLIHTQNSGYLEKDKVSYDWIRVRDFLLDWTPAALDAARYKE